MMKVVETRGRKEIAAVFMMCIVVRDLFAGDGTAQFHTAFLGLFNRPVVYFSWSGNRSFYIIFLELTLYVGLTHTQLSNDSHDLDRSHVCSW